MVPKIDNSLRVLYGRGDLGAISDDAWIIQQSRDVLLGERGDQLWLEFGECSPEVLPLAKDRDPGQPRLERLQGHALIDPLHTCDWSAPLLVVVGQILRSRQCPRAAQKAIRAGTCCSDHRASASARGSLQNQPARVAKRAELAI